MKKGPVKLIRLHCLRCAGSAGAVRECLRGPESSNPCVLWPFRMGKNPARKGIGRAMSSEDARFCRKGTSQDDSSARNFARQGEGTGKNRSWPTSHRVSEVRIDGPRLSPIEVMSQVLLRGLSGGGK